MLAELAKTGVTYRNASVGWNTKFNWSGNRAVRGPWPELYLGSDVQFIAPSMVYILNFRREGKK